MFCARKIVEIPEFIISALKINKIPEFNMIVALKMPEFYIRIAPKILFPNFRGGERGARAPLQPPPSPTPMTTNKLLAQHVQRSAATWRCCCIHRVNRVNSRSALSTMTAP